MAFNFDEGIDRRHSDSVKWRKYGETVLPMWVADTDFRAPDCVTAALQHRVAHGVFGYGGYPEGLAEATIAWCQRRYGWRVEPQWLVFLPGVVCALNICLRAFTRQDELSVIPTPVYPPFRQAALHVERAQRHAPLRLKNNRWVMDLSVPEETMSGRERLLMLCNPQNPGGTVYRREELLAQHEFARRHDLVVCSDEIHCDLLLEPGARHIPFAALNDDAAQRSITLMSPSKSFNIAGLGASVAIIPNPELRKRFSATMAGIVPHVDVLALTAAEAAWRDGEPWLNAQIDYLRRNRERLCSAVNALAGLSVAPPEATYLAWVDASGLQVESPSRFFRAAGLGFSPGREFGDAQFVRINFGCTAATLEEAIRRLERAVQIKA